ncbi:MAG: hypothetical protein R6U95_02930 [Bacteroidales bacterium]
MKFSFSYFCAYFISILFHPIVYVSLGSLVLLLILPEYSFIHSEAKLAYLYRTFLLTYVFPIIAIPLYFGLSYLFKLRPNTYHTRLFLLILTSFMYVFSYNILSQHAVFAYPNTFLLLTTILLFISLIISYFWRISLHMTGAGGFLGLILSLLFFRTIYSEILIISSILISGLVGYSRLRLNAHTESQLYTGFGVGLCTSLIFFFILIG